MDASPPFLFVLMIWFFLGARFILVVQFIMGMHFKGSYPSNVVDMDVGSDVFVNRNSCN